jgi:hypothetical protein
MSLGLPHAPDTALFQHHPNVSIMQPRESAALARRKCKSRGNAMIAGDWIYRSYLNNPDPVGGDPQKRSTTSSESAFSVWRRRRRIPSPGPSTWEAAWSSTLRGQISAGAGGLVTVQMAGLGRPGIGTDGWEYDYYGSPAYMWPAGVNQVLSLVRTVLRAKPHNDGKAGVTASFIAARRP